MPDAAELVRLSTFSEMAKQIASARTMAETINQVMIHVGQAFSPVNWSLLLRHGASGRLKFVHVTGEGSDQLRGVILERGQGVAGWVAENGEPQIVANAALDPRFHNKLDQEIGFETRSIIAVPLKARDRVYGVIELINKLDNTLFTDLDLHLLQTIADLAAIAIERVHYLKAVRKAALTDTLTGLHNRRSFERLLEREIEKTKRSRTLFALLFLDINHFKSVNDNHGHQAGDRVLETLAEVLTHCARKVDVCARVGGDEFAVLLPETDADGAAFLVRRIQQHLDTVVPELPIPFSVSIGARVVDPDAPERIITEADQAMYEDKMSDALQEVDDRLQEALEPDVSN